MKFSSIKSSDFGKAAITGAGMTIGWKLATIAIDVAAVLIVKGRAALSAPAETKSRKAA